MKSKRYSLQGGVSSAEFRRRFFYFSNEIEEVISASAFKAGIIFCLKTGAKSLLGTAK